MLLRVTHRRKTNARRRVSKLFRSTAVSNGSTRVGIITDDRRANVLGIFRVGKKEKTNYISSNPTRHSTN